MKYSLIVVQLLFASLLLGQSVKRNLVPGMKCSMEISDDFKLATRFNGFEHTSMNASIIVSILPNPLEKNKASIESDEMKKKGFIFVDKKEVIISNNKALLYELYNEGKNGKVRKYFLVFGDSTKTIFIDAMAPDSNEVLCGELKKVILTTIYDENMVEDPFASLSYSVSIDTSIFKVAKNSSNGVVYTNEEGNTPAFLSFSVASQAIKVKPNNEKEYAELKLKGLTGTDSMISVSINPITIHNLKGYVMESTTISKAKSTSYNYQIFLYGIKENYYLMMGRSMSSMETSRITFVPIAKSFQLK
ncbi:MAG: hypothetical protein ACKVQV_01635 [Bacteroidia bacterium]